MLKRVSSSEDSGSDLGYARHVRPPDLIPRPLSAASTQGIRVLKLLLEAKTVRYEYRKMEELRRLESSDGVWIELGYDESLRETE